MSLIFSFPIFVHKLFFNLGVFFQALSDTIYLTSISNQSPRFSPPQKYGKCAKLRSRERGGVCQRSHHTLLRESPNCHSQCLPGGHGKKNYYIEETTRKGRWDLTQPTKKCAAPPGPVLTSQSFDSQTKGGRLGREICRTNPSSSSSSSVEQPQSSRCLFCRYFCS